MSENRNDLSWSKSRDGALNDCPRRYYFHYYGWRGAFEPGADPRLREIWLLRQLRTRHIWIGELVHDVVERILRDLRDGVEPPPLEALLRDVRARMRTDFKASRERRFREERKPKSLALLEHDYAKPVSDEQWRECAEQVDRCLTTFFAHPSFGRIRKLDPHTEWLELEDLRGFDIDGVRVHVKLDFAHRDGADAVVLDWKTGKGNSDYRLQFGCYVHYVSARFGLEPERVRGLELNLATGKDKEHRFTRQDLDGIEATIRASIARMRSLLRDPAQNLAVESDFPLNASRWRCGNCNFLRVCPEGDIPR